MIRALRLLPVLLLASVSCAEAAETTPFTFNGDFAFETAELKDGKPVCNERWRFAPDGGLTIFSGQEVVTARYRAEVIPDDHGGEHWLMVAGVSTNGLPDCRGRRSNVVPSGEQRFFFYVAAAGNLVLCRAGGTGEHKVLEPVWLGYRAREGDRP